MIMDLKQTMNNLSSFFLPFIMFNNMAFRFSKYEFKLFVTQASI